MIWTMLMLICVGASIVAAYQAASGAGVAGHAVAVLIGAAIGVGSAVAMQTSVAVLERRFSHFSDRMKEWVFGGAYLGVLVVTFICAVAASWLTTKALGRG